MIHGSKAEAGSAFFQNTINQEENMIHLLGSYEYAVIAFIGIIFAFAATCIAIAKLNQYLPKDMGRQFAHDGKLSAGKPRGAGIIFIFTFVIAAVLFSQINIEIAIYLVLIVILIPLVIKQAK